MRTSPAEATATAVLPSTRTIAFAVAIVHSKPTELSIEEYISLLSQHVAKGRRKDTVSHQHGHLDQSSFWQSEYDRAAGDLRAAEDEIVRLQQQMKAVNARATASHPATAIKKRQQHQGLMSPSSLPDKTVTGRHSEESNDETSILDSLDSDLNVDQSSGTTYFPISRFGEAAKSQIDGLLSSLFYLHNVHARHEGYSAADRGYYLEQATMSLRQSVRHIFSLMQDKAISHEGDEGDFDKALVATNRAFSIILAGLQKLSRLSGHEVTLGRCTYAISDMFREFVHLMDDLAHTQAIQLDEPCKTRSQDDASRETNGKKQGSGLAGIKPNAILQRMTKLITGLVNMLDRSLPGHTELFDAFAFCIIELSGQTLYLHTFGYPRPESLEDEITDAGYASAASAGHPLMDKIKKRKAEILSPYLILLLRHTISKAAENLEWHNSGRRAKAKAPSSRPLTKDKLTIVARERLQRTLVDCMFGLDDSGKLDVTRVCLRFPIERQQDIALPRIKSTDVGGWFQKEVWRLLGWDILTTREGL